MKFLLLFLFLFSSFAFAQDSSTATNFWDGFTTFFQEIQEFIFVYIPATIQRFVVYVASYALYLQYLMILSSLDLAFSVAQSFLNLVDLSGAISAATSGLPLDLQRAAYDFRFFECVTLVIEAYIARFVFDVVS